VCNSPGISQDTLAKNLYINKSTVTRALATLEENGFIERRQSEVDRRITLVYPTDKATDSLPFVRESAKSWNEFLLSCLDEKERETLGEMIEKIAKKAESYVEGNMSAKDIIKK
jgi:DNA-binding MarR family transcriptional regulator